MIADPPVRLDGLCVCGKPRRVPATKRVRAEAAADPFCSVECCRRWHRCELVRDPKWGNGTSTLGTGRQGKKAA